MISEEQNPKNLERNSGQNEEINEETLEELVKRSLNPVSKFNSGFF